MDGKKKEFYGYQCRYYVAAKAVEWSGDPSVIHEIKGDSRVYRSKIAVLLEISYPSR